MGYRSSTQKYHHCHWKEWNLRVQSDGQAPSRSVVVQKWTTATVFRVRSLCCPSWYRPDLSSVHKFLSGEDRDPPTLPYWWRSIAEICAVSWIGWSFRGKKFVSRNNQSDQTQISVMHFWINKETTKFREETISVLAGFHLGPLSWSNWNLEMLRREKNWRTRRKTLGARRELTTQLTYGNGLDSNPSHIGGRLALPPLCYPLFPLVWSILKHQSNGGWPRRDISLLKCRNFKKLFFDTMKMILFVILGVIYWMEAVYTC